MLLCAFLVALPILSAGQSCQTAASCPVNYYCEASSRSCRQHNTNLYGNRIGATGGVYPFGTGSVYPYTFVYPQGQVQPRRNLIYTYAGGEAANSYISQLRPSNVNTGTYIQPQPINTGTYVQPVQTSGYGQQVVQPPTNPYRPPVTNTGSNYINPVSPYRRGGYVSPVGK